MISGWQALLQPVEVEAAGGQGPECDCRRNDGRASSYTWSLVQINMNG